MRGFPTKWQWPHRDDGLGGWPAWLLAAFNIITNTLLPALSREFLHRAMDKQEVSEAMVKIENGDFVYAVS